MRRPITAAALLLALAGLQAASEGATANAIAAIVNDEIVTVGEVQVLASRDLASIPDRPAGPAREQRRQEVLRGWTELLIQRALLKQAARKVFKDNPASEKALDKEVRKEVKRLAVQSGSLDLAKQDAHERGLTWEEKTALIRDAYMMEIYLHNMVDQKISITPKELRDYYNKHLAQFSSRKLVKLRRIVVKLDRFKKPEDAWDHARKIRKRIDAGEDFALLVRTYSDGPRARAEEAANAGLFGFDEVYALKPKLRHVALTMEQGEVSDIVATDTGLEIIKVEEARPARKVGFEEAQKEIRDILTEELRRKRQEELMEKLKSRALVRYVRFKKR